MDIWFGYYKVSGCEKLGAKMSDGNIADAEKQGCKRILEYLKAYKS